MASTSFFIGMIVLAVILLIIITIAAIIGAIALAGSKYFDTNSRVKTAHSWLTAAAVIGSIILFIMIILAVYIFAKSPFSSIYITEAFLANSTPTAKDIALAWVSEKQLKAGETARSFILISLIFITFLTILLGIFCGVAAFQMSEVLNRDQKAVDGANAAFIGAFAGVLEIGVVIVVTVLALALKNEAKDDINKLDNVLTTKKSPMTEFEMKCLNDPTNPFC